MWRQIRLPAKSLVLEVPGSRQNGGVVWENPQNKTESRSHKLFEKPKFSVSTGRIWKYLDFCDFCSYSFTSKGKLRVISTTLLSIPLYSFRFQRNTSQNHRCQDYYFEILMSFCLIKNSMTADSQTFRKVLRECQFQSRFWRLPHARSFMGNSHRPNLMGVAQHPHAYFAAYGSGKLFSECISRNYSFKTCTQRFNSDFQALRCIGEHLGAPGSRKIWYENRKSGWRPLWSSSTAQLHREQFSYRFSVFPDNFTMIYKKNQNDLLISKKVMPT